MQQVDIGSIDTLILCGGRGKRLKSIVSHKPKILVEVQNIPFINYLLNYLESQGIKKVILCTGYKHHLVEKWVTLYYKGSIKIRFSQEQESLGTAGAIRHADRLRLSDNIIVLNGDTFTNLSYFAFLKDFMQKNNFASIAVKKSVSTLDYGSIITDNNGRLLSFKEKSLEYKNSFINVGVYIFRKEIINEIKKYTKTSLETETIPNILKQKNKLISTFTHKGIFIDYGTPKRYNKISKMNLTKYI